MRHRPSGRAVIIALMRADNKPPVELVVGNLVNIYYLTTVGIESIFHGSGYALIFSHIVSIKYKTTFVVRCNGRKGVFTHVILATV